MDWEFIELKYNTDGNWKNVCTLFWESVISQYRKAHVKICYSNIHGTSSEKQWSGQIFPSFPITSTKMAIRWHFNQKNPRNA